MQKINKQVIVQHDCFVLSTFNKCPLFYISVDKQMDPIDPVDDSVELTDDFRIWVANRTLEGLKDGRQLGRVGLWSILKTAFEALDRYFHKGRVGRNTTKRGGENGVRITVVYAKHLGKREGNCTQTHTHTHKHARAHGRNRGVCPDKLCLNITSISFKANGLLLLEWFCGHCSHPKKNRQTGKPSNRSVGST